MTQKEEQLKTLIEHSSRITVLTGAGISTESGISDYRSQGGLWDRFQPVTLQEFIADEASRELYWERKKFMYSQMREAQPNAAHRAFARLEVRGQLLGLITQNIDGLHTLAGSRKICEIHGTNREVVCLDCGATGPFDPVYERLLAGEKAPRCLTCRGLLKPNTISFGQSLDPDSLRQALAWARQCDLMIVAGSSLVVEPAASLPRTAKEEGAAIVIINREPTPLDKMADLVVHAALGAVLDQAIP